MEPSVQITRLPTAGSVGAGFVGVGGIAIATTFPVNAVLLEIGEEAVFLTRDGATEIRLRLIAAASNA